MHGHPELLDGISSALRECQNGASVFRLATLDDELAAEVAALRERGFALYMAAAGDARAARDVGDAQAARDA